MFGLPGETVADAFETVEMMQKIQPDLFLLFQGNSITGNRLVSKYTVEMTLITIDSIGILIDDTDTGGGSKTWQK